MTILSLDTETTIWNKGHHADSRNKMVCWSYAKDNGDFGAHPSDVLDNLHCFVNSARLIVGFHFKFDLHWLLKYGLDQLRHKQIWDVQLAEFILSNQTHRFPSLDETCAKYGIPTKLDIVRTEYWEKGINTDEIPWEILSEYAAWDAKITLECYYAQRKLMTPAQITLCYLMCQDLQILQEMEANGIPFDEQLCDKRAQEVDDQISAITKSLSGVYPNIPLNFSSNDHLSAFLYGGSIFLDGKEHIGFYKTGAKAGQPKYKNITIEHVLPRIYNPIKGSELKKAGYFATDAATLRKLKGPKKIITWILDLARLEKINGTYYRGLPALRKEMNWPEGMLHGNFNQTTAQTGRLSSSRPNLQNFSSELQDVFISAYKETIE